MGIAPDIAFEQSQGGEEKAFDLLEGLAADQLDQAAVDLPQGLLMDQAQPLGIHDPEEEEHLAVFGETVVGLLFGIGRRKIGVRHQFSL